MCGVIGSSSAHGNCNSVCSEFRLAPKQSKAFDTHLIVDDPEHEED